jgi:hypothetical protein
MGRSAEVRVGFLTIIGDPLRWQRLGFDVDADGSIRFLDCSIRLIDVRRPGLIRDDGSDDEPASSGLIGWELTTGDVRVDLDVDVHVDRERGAGSDGAEDALEIDGLATRFISAQTPRLVEHGNGAIGLDHVVVLTGSLERTSAAIEAATGAPLKRIRELDQMRQGFHRLGVGGLIVEIVERPELAEHPVSMFWGFVVNVADLDATVEMIGPDMIGPAKPAVQAGRRIATIRREARIGVPLAFMST